MTSHDLALAARDLSRLFEAFGLWGGAGFRIGASGFRASESWCW